MPDTDPYVTRDGWPWGWGAYAVDTPPRDWRCPLCRRVRRRGRHFYPPSTLVCTDCASTWCRSIVSMVKRDGRRKAPPHGTRDRYYYGDGCRCEACREANAAYQRHRYAQAKADAHPAGVVDVVDADGNVIGAQHPLFD